MDPPQSVETAAFQQIIITQRLQSSSFLDMTYFFLRDYNIQPKKELLWSLWVLICYHPEAQIEYGVDTEYEGSFQDPILLLMVEILHDLV